MVCADGDKVDTSLLESIHLGGEGTELFDAVGAAFAEVKDDDHRFAGIIGQRMFFALPIGEGPLRGGGRRPPERPKRVE